MAIKQALIVDDSKSARLVLKRMLKELTLNVDTVESAIDALGYLENHQPDVIFMDHMMPGMDGKYRKYKHPTPFLTQVKQNNLNSFRRLSTSKATSKALIQRFRRITPS